MSLIKQWESLVSVCSCAHRAEVMPHDNVNQVACPAAQLQERETQHFTKIHSVCSYQQRALNACKIVDRTVAAVKLKILERVDSPSPPDSSARVNIILLNFCYHFIINSLCYVGVWTVYELP